MVKSVLRSAVCICMVCAIAVSTAFAQSIIEETVYEESVGIAPLDIGEDEPQPNYPY